MVLITPAAFAFLVFLLKKIKNYITLLFSGSGTTFWWSTWRGMTCPLAASCLIMWVLVLPRIQVKELFVCWFYSGAYWIWSACRVSGCFMLQKPSSPCRPSQVRVAGLWTAGDPVVLWGRAHQPLWWRPWQVQDQELQEEVQLGSACGGNLLPGGVGRLCAQTVRAARWKINNPQTFSTRNSHRVGNLPTPWYYFFLC